MSLIKLQPMPKVPPIGFFQPISVDPKDMMTDVEYLLGILKRLNEIIVQVNSNTTFIEEYDGKINEIEAEIAALRTEMSEFEDEITDSITSQFNTIKAELQTTIAITLAQANAYTDALGARLEEEIQEISLGQISLYDPTTGTVNPLQTVIDNIYSSTREDALTASEYDGLELTATAYDAYQLTAYEYDKSGKTLLV